MIFAHPGGGKVAIEIDRDQMEQLHGALHKALL